MFGIYDFFPENLHGIARFSYHASIRKLQGILIYTLHQLNQCTENPLDFAHFNMELILEFGIADGITFNYLDRQMLKHCLERFRGQTFSTLDFFCVARYHIAEGEKRKPLRFDYYILRFLFYEKEIELQVFHEKGTQRLSIEDLIMLLMKNINQELRKRNLNPLNMNYLRAL